MPPRVARPDATRFGVRLDWEYGALPAELSPAVTQESDFVIVHSRAVRRMLAAAGCSTERIELVPHGVDGNVFDEDAPPLQEVLDFKGGRDALLFVGGLIWRKGVDLLMGALLEQRSTVFASPQSTTRVSPYFPNMTLAGFRSR